MSSSHITIQKQQIRSEIRTILKKLPVEERNSASASICQEITQLLGSPHQKHLTIASFVGLNSEPDLSALHRLLPQHSIVYPCSKPAGEMSFHKTDDYHSLEKGLYGILQPAGTPATLVPPEQIDIFLCPGLAFTDKGKRLGKGGGYYDRLLAQRNPQSRLIGICFSQQRRTHLPTDDHDITVGKIIHSRYPL